MEAEAARARWHRLHEKAPWHDGTFTRWAPEPSTQYPYKYDMGVTIGVSDVDLRPDDLFLTRERAPWPPESAAPDESADAEHDDGDH